MLRSYPLGEADRIIELCTLERGKVRAVAKGVRKTKSKFGARLEPLTHVAVQMHEGRNLDIVTQAEVIDSWKIIREDLDRTGKAVTAAEAVWQLSKEGQPDPRMHKMLLGALRTIEADDPALIVPAFLCKLLAHEGVQPILDRCAMCDVDDPLVAFDLARGGALCASHRSGPSLSGDGLLVLKAIFGGGLAAALEIPPSPVAHEIDAIATLAFETHIERRLRSPHLLDR